MYLYIDKIIYDNEVYWCVDVSSCICRAKKDLESHLVVLDTWDEFCSYLDKKMIIMAPFCGEPSCEDLIKKNSAR